jgi:nucleoside 2-deoxyribosyltransferase
MPRIYWANTLFTEAQRSFNRHWAKFLRENGYDVFLPQELLENEVAYSPTPEEIFYLDTAAILQSDALVAVIDDETIDCGVAAEMGIAHATGIPVVAVYTDIRRNRTVGAMYKNLYVVGIAELSLGIVSAQTDLLERLQRLNALRRQQLPRSTGGVDTLDATVAWLEAHSEPYWCAHDSVIALARQTDAISIVDFGCGTGSLALKAMDYNPAISYYGFDIERERIELARRRYRQAYFEHDFNAFMRILREHEVGNSCILNFSFVLHDVEDLSSARKLIEVLSRPKIIIQDLTSSDLPHLVAWLSRSAGRLPDWSNERRMSFGRISQITSALEITLETLKTMSLQITFDEAADVIRYCDQFDLFEGSDIPVRPFSKPSYLRSSLSKVLETVSFPCTDTRLYVVGVATKTAGSRGSYSA